MSETPARDDVVTPSSSEEVLAEVKGFFAVGRAKLITMSIFTLGLYELYWFYKNFSCMKTQGHNIWPIPRAIFAGIMSYSLFNAIKMQVTDAKFSAGWLAVAYFFILGAMRLPDPWWLVSFLSFLPMLPIRDAIDRINSEVAPESDPNTRIKGWNYLAFVLGIPFLLLVLVGTFMPVE